MMQQSFHRPSCGCGKCNLQETAERNAPFTTWGQHSARHTIESEPFDNLATTVTFDRNGGRNSTWNLIGNAAERESELKNWYSPFAEFIPFWRHKMEVIPVAIERAN